MRKNASDMLKQLDGSREPDLEATYNEREQSIRGVLLGHSSKEILSIVLYHSLSDNLHCYNNTRNTAKRRCRAESSEIVCVHVCFEKFAWC